jgi:hypothetical protein
MIYRTKVDAVFYIALGLVLLFCAGLLYLLINSFDVKILILLVFFSVAEVFFLIPMCFFTRYTLGEQALTIHVGWFAKRTIEYESIFAFQKSAMDANVSYGFSEKKLALFFINDRQGNDVITITPRDEDGFIRRFSALTGLVLTPPDPSYKDLQKEYDAKTSPERRRIARKKLWNVVSKGFDPERIEPVSPETIEEFNAQSEKETGNDDE